MTIVLFAFSEAMRAARMSTDATVERLSASA
jgi:hypothetical protein